MSIHYSPVGQLSHAPKEIPRSMGLRIKLASLAVRNDGRGGGLRVTLPVVAARNDRREPGDSGARPE
jgi:hypothetical protein